jgi:hypothetical protein
VILNLTGSFFQILPSGSDGDESEVVPDEKTQLKQASQSAQLDTQLKFLHNPWLSSRDSETGKFATLT